MTAKITGGIADRNTLENRFGYHPPTRPSIVDQHQEIRNRCFVLAQRFTELIPESRELSLALTKLEEVMFWANAGVARIGNYQDKP